MIQRLELRPWPFVVLAYVVGPVVGLTCWLAGDTFPKLWLLPPYNAFPNDPLTLWLMVIAIGLPICLAIEGALVTPLLLAWNRHRWAWLNGWSAAGIGFLLGAAPCLLLFALNPSPSPDQIPGGVTICKAGRCTHESWTQAGLGPPPPLDHPPVIWVVDGHWTLAGWGHVANATILMGVVGLVAAIVFRLLAMRSVRRLSDQELRSA